jgi:PAS domain S-box-containing protein
MKNKKLKQISGDDNSVLTNKYIDSILNSLEDAVMATNVNGHIIYMNSKACTMTGCKFDQGIGKTIEKVFSNQITGSGAKPGNTVELVLRKGKPVHSNTPIEINTKEGKIKCIQESGSPVCDNKKNITGVVLVFRNMTDEFRVQETLQASEEKYRTVVENTGTATTIIEKDGTIILANRRFETLTGYTKEDIQNKKTWMEFVVSEDLDMMLHQHKLRREHRKKALTEYEFRFVNRTGEIKHIHLFIDVIPGTDRSVASLLDITERKEAEIKLAEQERRLDSMVSNLPGFVYRCKFDKSWTMLYLSSAVEKITGYAPDSFINNKKIAYNDIIIKAHQSMVRKGWEKAISEQKFNEVEYQICTSENKYKWVWERGKCVCDHEGNILFLEGYIEDITERKLATEELHKLKNKLEKQVAIRTAELNEKIRYLDKNQKAMLNMTADLKEERRKLQFSNKELEAFTYSVSHDLRAPLRAINGFSQFLAEDYSKKLDDEGKRYIDTIRNNAIKMDKLISDLLNMSRVSTAELSLTEVDMDAIVKSVFYEAATEHEQKEFEIKIRKLPSIRCDIILIKQVWQNLITNALKYSSKSTVKKIEIWSDKQEEETVFCIKDHGAGFNPKYKTKLFGVFQRLHTEQEFKGTGVGLALVQRIIHRHGGNIWASGNIDAGARFCFSLPRK